MPQGSHTPKHPTHTGFLAKWVRREPGQANQGKGSISIDQHTVTISRPVPFELWRKSARSCGDPAPGKRRGHMRSRGSTFDSGGPCNRWDTLAPPAHEVKRPCPGWRSGVSVTRVTVDFLHPLEGSTEQRRSLSPWSIRGFPAPRHLQAMGLGFGRVGVQPGPSPGALWSSRYLLLCAYRGSSH